MSSSAYRGIINAGKVKNILLKHPWVYGKSLRLMDPDMPSGECIDLHDIKENFLARGFYNKDSSITVRLMSWEKAKNIDDDLVKNKVLQAIKLRQDTLNLDSVTNSYRVIHSESDGLPGLIVDRFGDYLVLQMGSLGMSKFTDAVVEALTEHFKPRGIYERVDKFNNKLEGMERSPATLYGEEKPDDLVIEEYGIKFSVNLHTGQKTGFYTDQRENRHNLARYCEGKTVLDAYCYTGAFGLHAVQAGAKHVVGIDSSAPALEIGEKNLKLNNTDAMEFVKADVSEFLKLQDSKNPRFDVIVLDPPKLAPRKANVDKASRLYQRINQQAMHIIKPGGLLFTCSCSHHMTNDIFDKMLAEAAMASGKHLQILEKSGQSADHPNTAAFAEGHYLKTRLCRVC